MQPDYVTSSVVTTLFFSRCLLRVNQVKDLGVLFDHKFDFSAHIDYIVCKGNSMLGFLKRNSVAFNDAYTLKTMFCSLVLPILEYCCVVWSPFYKNNSLRIERIQKKFTRYALRKLNWSNDLPNYSSRCALIAMNSLECRRDALCILFIKDIVSFHINSIDLLSFMSFYVPERILRNRNEIFHIPTHRTNYGLNEPITRSLILFNSICEEVDICINRAPFKRLVFNALNNL